MAERTVGVVGASGAVGAEIVEVLDRATWRPELVALARQSTTVSHVDYGDDRIPIDDVADLAMDAVDALILAIPADVASEIAEEALDEGIPVIDASGALAAAGLPVVVPWINPEALQGAMRGVALPSAEALLLASALGPLRRAGITGAVQATILAPASSAGRDGIDELSRQVVALLNGGTPPRKVFEQGLAFDLIPHPPAGRIARIASDLVAMGVLDPETPLEIHWVGVPVFSGMSATLAIQPSGRLDPGAGEALGRVLAEGGVAVAEGEGPRSHPRPRRVDGKAFAHASGIRIGAGGDVRMWLVMDNLRTLATAAAACTAAIFRLGAG